MSTNESDSENQPLPFAKMGPGEFRMTTQRRQIYEAVMSRSDHPSASEVFVQVKDVLPSISLATVYNCLEAMHQNGIVRQVNLDREPSRYCANLADHAHLYCQECGQVSDVPMKDMDHLSKGLDLPAGAQMNRLDVTVRGLCSECTTETSTT